MNIRSCRSRPLVAVLSAALLLALPTASWSQAPVPPNPQAPNLAMPVPLGVQRGNTLDLTLTGTNLAEPTALWTSFPAKVTIPTDANNGKDNAKLRVRLEVPKDAPLGFHALRLSCNDRKGDGRAVVHARACRRQAALLCPMTRSSCWKRSSADRTALDGHARAARCAAPQQEQ